MLSSDVDARLESPDNLLNRLRRMDSSVGSSLSVISTESDTDTATDIIIDSILRESNPFMSKTESESRNPPSLSDLVPDSLDQIKSNLAQNTALEVMQESLDNLRGRLCEVDTVKDLSRIAQDMSKIIGNLRPKDQDRPRQGNIIIYKPTVADVSQYKSVMVNE
jgi:hypothetical protein